MTVGDHLKAWRTTARLSQERLGDLLGHSRPTTVQSWEKGRRTPKAKTVRLVGELLQVDQTAIRSALDALIGIETKATPPRSVARVVSPPAPSDPLARGFEELLTKCSSEDRQFLVQLVNEFRRRCGLPAVEQARARGRALAR